MKTAKCVNGVNNINRTDGTHMSLGLLGDTSLSFWSENTVVKASLVASLCVDM